MWDLLTIPSLSGICGHAQDTVDKSPVDFVSASHATLNPFLGFLRSHFMPQSDHKATTRYISSLFPEGCRKYRFAGSFSRAPIPSQTSQKMSFDK